MDEEGQAKKRRLLYFQCKLRVPPVLVVFSCILLPCYHLYSHFRMCSHLIFLHFGSFPFSYLASVSFFNFKINFHQSSFILILGLIFFHSFLLMLLIHLGYCSSFIFLVFCSFFHVFPFILTRFHLLLTIRIPPILIHPIFIFIFNPTLSYSPFSFHISILHRPP